MIQTETIQDTAMNNMINKIIPIYSIILGIAILGMWTFLILSGDINEGKSEISFHLFSEFLMAILCIAGGILYLRIKYKYMLIMANAMVVYSVINAAGYYAEKGIIPAVPAFTALALFSSAILIMLSVNHKKS